MITEEDIWNFINLSLKVDLAYEKWALEFHGEATVEYELIGIQKFVKRGDRVFVIIIEDHVEDSGDFQRSLREFEVGPDK